MGNMSEGIRLKPYDGSIDFTIWKVKMKATLMKEKCYSAVTKDRPAETSELKKVKLNDMAHAEIFIRLSNDVARQVPNYGSGIRREVHQNVGGSTTLTTVQLGSRHTH
ncbi:hypothetical protein LINPERPRIM_LOCUS22374 [Linum perenne]